MLDAPDDCTGMCSEFIRKVASTRFLLRAFLFIDCYESKTLIILLVRGNVLAANSTSTYRKKKLQFLFTALLAIVKPTHSFRINHLVSKL